MKPAFQIALRFFLESKRSMTLSALGVVFGVAFFICGQAQTQGFERYFIETILGSRGAIIVSDRIQQTYAGGKGDKDKGKPTFVAVRNQLTAKYEDGVDEPPRLMEEILSRENVRACSPILESGVTIKSAFGEEPATLLGIDLDYHLEASDFEKQLREGTVEDFRESPDALAVGAMLAERLELRQGQHVTVVAGKQTKRFRITNIFETGISSIDERRVYCHLRTARSLLQQPHEVSYLLIQLHDPSRAQADAKALQESYRYKTRAWQDREKGNLQIFATLRISAGIGVSCIIFLAGFSIFNILTMSVLEKTKEIAILRSMGYSRNDISAIFILQGMCLAAVGTVMGWGVGAAMTYGISNIPIRIRGIFSADHFVVDWSWDHYVLAAILATLSVFFASYFPASRAARVEPVNILRGTSA